MSTYFTQQRKHNDYITIAHISDLHFKKDIELPDFNKGQNSTMIGAHLKTLIEDVQKFGTDILCLTGDIEDNTWKEALRRADLSSLNNEERLADWNTHLTIVFERMRTFLEDACKQLSINPQEGLFVSNRSGSTRYAAVG